MLDWSARQTREIYGEKAGELGARGILVAAIHDNESVAGLYASGGSRVVSTGHLYGKKL